MGGLGDLADVLLELLYFRFPKQRQDAAVHRIAAPASSTVAAHMGDK
jgi:hypothetical protein